MKDRPGDYEFPDSGHVKLKLSPSEAEWLDNMGKQPPKRNSDTESSVSTSAESNKVNEGLTKRFVATLLVLVSAGLFCIISHRPLTSSSTTVVYMGGLINFGLLLTFARWTQLHSQKLTRHVRPMLDIAQILRTNAVFRPDGSAWLMPEKYVAYNLCCADPCIDEEAPRTEEREEATLSDLENERVEAL